MNGDIQKLLGVLRSISRELTASQVRLTLSVRGVVVEGDLPAGPFVPTRDFASPLLDRIGELRNRPEHVERGKPALDAAFAEVNALLKSKVADEPEFLTLSNVLVNGLESPWWILRVADIDGIHLKLAEKKTE